ncbi:uncharacterized protein LOC131050040 [Cryptomeria japonica]|uniref:uncharacterized protein LOC131050040 n=1 Tax=Cryptomeria japonica TaxID=3369 RepID=UPI0027DA3444|nr:uncharacterized protein LOC131050040 [Cryptomeria japonica]
MWCIVPPLPKEIELISNEDIWEQKIEVEEIIENCKICKKYGHCSAEYLVNGKGKEKVGELDNVQTMTKQLMFVNIEELKNERGVRFVGSEGNGGHIDTLERSQCGQENGSAAELEQSGGSWRRWQGPGGEQGAGGEEAQRLGSSQGAATVGQGPQGGCRRKGGRRGGGGRKEVPAGARSRGR